MEDSDKLEIIRKHAAQLSEHFDTVHIFCTKHLSDSEGTEQYNVGKGNFFARKGQIDLWVKYEDAKDIGNVWTPDEDTGS